MAEKNNDEGKIKFSKEEVKSASYCNFCPKMCRFVCPPAEVLKDEAFVPTQKVGALWEIIKGFNEGLDAAKYSFTGCFMCFACREYCYHSINVPALIAKAREVILKNKPYEDSLKIIENIVQQGNFFGEKFNFSESLFEEVVEKEALLFPGCFVLKHEMELLKEYENFFRHYNINYIGLPEEEENLCCGYPLYALGDFDSFKNHAKKLSERLKKYGVIINLCPHCAYTFKVLYPEMGVKTKFDVLTAVEFINNSLKYVPERILRDLFIYHDPCYLGRGLGIYDEPRNLLWKAVENIKEFQWSRQDSECCGGGGIVSEINPELSEAALNHRIGDLEEKFEIVTPCPHCRYIFRTKSRKTSDIVEILMRALQ